MNNDIINGEKIIIYVPNERSISHNTETEKESVIIQKNKKKEKNVK